MGGYLFYFLSGETVQQLMAPSLRQLTEKARLTLLAQGIPPPEELSVIIEHQICLRQPDPKSACWSSGLGDDLHNKWVKTFLSSAARAITVIGTPTAKNIGRAITKVATCQTCAGTTVYDPQANNLGRAGNLNSLFPQ